MWPFVALAAVGTAVSIYGQIKAAKDQEEAAKRDAAIKGMQADELLARNAINEQAIREQSERTASSHQAAFAGTGREGGGIGGVLQIRKDTEEAIMNYRRDAEFKARMLRLGASNEMDLASDLVTASYIGAAGTALSSGASMYSAMKPAGSAKPLNGGQTGAGNPSGGY